MTEALLSDRERRQSVADRIKSMDDVSLPVLKYWNYAACPKHVEQGPQISCEYRECGGDLFSHQRVGIAWLYAIKKGLLADDPGVGKTNQLLGLLALLKERGELTHRAVIIPQTPAVQQWGTEIARWIPGVKSIVVDGSIPKDVRIQTYGSSWDVLVIGSHIAIRDHEELEGLRPFDLVVSDDVDPLLAHDNATHRAIMNFAEGAERSFTVNATALQTRLEQLHAALTPAGGHDIFGSLTAFQNRYVRKELVTDYSGGKKRVSRQQTGYKNISELQDKVRSLYLRRKATELTDIRMPTLMPPQTEWLEMSVPQAEKYAELQQGVIRLIKENGADVKHLNALTQFLYGQQICAGLPALGESDGPGASPKLDWLFNRLTTVWDDRKTIAFVKNVGMVGAAIERCQRHNIGIAMIWGQKQNSKQRQEQKEKFWDDPNCRLLIGTSSLERSHNLQCANTVVAIDTHLNWARMSQLLGRAKRAGSPHERVFFFTLLMRGTQEERYMKKLEERQAIYTTVFEEEGELYKSLSPLELLALMRPF